MLAGAPGVTGRWLLLVGLVLPLSLGNSVLVLGLAWAVLLIGSGLLALRQAWPQVRAAHTEGERDV